jgi:lycopene beta-cyclase
MTADKHDIAIIGGGLSGGLIALAPHQRHPDLTLCLIESGACLGGNHRWRAFPETRRDTGYVHFPGHAGTPRSTYRSLSSEDLAAMFASEPPPPAIRLQTSAAEVNAQGVTLADSARIKAGTVIDCRGVTPFPHPKAPFSRSAVA